MESSSKSSWRRAAIRIGGSALILGVLFTVLPVDELWGALQRIPLFVWAAGVAIYVSLHFMGVLKFRLTTNLSGAGLSVLQAARSYYAGLFGNTFLPSIVGGDVVRAGLALGQARSKTGLVVGALLDRLLDMTALATVAGIGVILLPGQLDPQSQRVFWFLASVFAVGALGLLAAWMFLPARRFPFKVRRRLVNLRQALRSVARRPHVVLLSLCLGVALQSSLVVLSAWLGQWCGLDCALSIWFFVWPLAKLSAMVPVTQGGIGIREAALAALFAPFGIDAAVAVAAGLLFQSVVITGGLLGGPFALLTSRGSVAGPALPCSDPATPSVSQEPVPVQS